jgi:DNA topoisomerase VI subunit B
MSTNAAFSNGNVVPGEFQAVNREFSIKQSAHAIHVLSTSLYSRPIEAVIRELSCNALDSHKVAGVTVPFEVSLNSNPNREFTFSVRDFGTGLEPEALERLYTTYFDSTKEQGDGFIGSFGLGSKSPFAYTKKFFINDYYFGIVHKYEAFIDEETHIPVLNKLSEDTSPELANGLEITFEVRYGDMSKFQEAALKVFKFLGIK